MKVWSRLGLSVFVETQGCVSLMSSGQKLWAAKLYQGDGEVLIWDDRKGKFIAELRSRNEAVGGGSKPSGKRSPLGSPTATEA